MEIEEGKLEHIPKTYKCFAIMLPIVISFSSLVMGYFMTYLSMMEEYLQK